MTRASSPTYDVLIVARLLRDASTPNEPNPGARVRHLAHRRLVSALLRGLDVDIREHGLDVWALAAGTTRMRFLVFGDVLLELEHLAAFAAAVLIGRHGGFLHVNIATHAEGRRMRTRPVLTCTTRLSQSPPRRNPPRVWWAHRPGGAARSCWSRSQASSRYLRKFISAKILCASLYGRCTHVTIRGSCEEISDP